MQAPEPRAELSDRELGRITELVYERSGITLHAGKRELVVARLQKRLRAHGLTSYSEYLRLIDADTSGDELVALLDAISTNHTYFFREEEHFRVLAERVVPEWRTRGAQGLRVWTAACSTGEEPYTIAMTLDSLAPKPEFTLLASDLSTRALQTARAGVYRSSDVSKLPAELLRRHFERGMGAEDGLARVKADLRRRVAFRRLNLLEVDSLGTTFDVIFCRNVMIYFDRAVQQRVVSMLERHLAPSGYLFIAHSESLNGITHRMRWVAPAVYQRGTHA